MRYPLVILFLLAFTTVVHAQMDSILHGWAQSPAGKYSIKGIVSGFADSTKIYMGDTDSAWIVSNRFQFNGTQTEKARQVILRTDRYADYKFLWLEKGALTFRADKGKFREAVITGSITQREQEKLDAAIAKTGNEKQESIAFIRSHPHSVISGSILGVYATSWGKDTTAMLYDGLSKEIKQNPDGRHISDFLTLNKQVKVGDHYIDFASTDTAGKKIYLSALKGKTVLLEFWGSWCGPCREGNPELLRIYNEFKSKGFEIFGVATDSKKEEWIGAIRHDGLTWLNVSDLKGDQGQPALIYGISYYPTSFLIDANGLIIAKDLRGEALHNKLLELFK